MAILDVSPKPFGDFLEKELPQQRDWIAPGVLPRGGTMIVAATSKTGKSFVALELCRSLSLGENPFECPLLWVPRPARVLYLEAEVKEQGLQTRGRPIFQGVSREYLNNQLFALTEVPELQFDSGKGFQLLRQALDEVQPEVLIVDPLGRFIGGLDENSNSEMSKVLNKLDQVLKDYKRNEMALILVHHSKKPNRMDQDFDPLSPHEMRGASRFFANPDTIFMLHRDKDYVNPFGKSAWTIKGRLETRQAERLPDLEFTVNHKSDLRVRYVPKKGKMEPVHIPAKPGVAPPPTQLGFSEAPEASFSRKD